MFDLIYKIFEIITPKIDISETFIVKSTFIETIFYICLILQIYWFIIKTLKRNEKFNFKSKVKDWDKKIKKVSLVWNICLSSYSFISFLYFISKLKRNLYLDHYSFTKIICVHDTNNYLGAGGFWIYMFTLSKIFELGDTVILVLKNPKRKLSFLHWYHHVTVLLITLISFNSTSQDIIIPACINNFIHSIMYFYYALTDLDYKPKWGIILTGLQILQMIIGGSIPLFWILFYVILKKWECTMDLYFEKNKIIVHMLGLFIYGSYFYLFLQFFINKYGIQLLLLLPTIK